MNKTMNNFDFVSFTIGLLLGMIIMLIFVWIAYYTRTILFTYCPYEPHFCLSGDYYMNPGEALASDSNLKDTDILVVHDGKLYYKRITKNPCTPGKNQTIVVPFPQFCLFRDDAGGEVLYKNKQYNSPFYLPYHMNESNGNIQITSLGHCDPMPGMAMTSGTPVAKWE